MIRLLALAAGLPLALSAQPLRVANRYLEVRLEVRTGTLQVRDKRAGREWAQKAAASDVAVKKARVAGAGFVLELLDAASQVAQRGCAARKKIKRQKAKISEPGREPGRAGICPT